MKWRVKCAGSHHPLETGWHRKVWGSRPPLSALNINIGMRYIDLMELNIPSGYNADVYDYLYDNHPIVTDVSNVESGFITTSGKIIDTSNIDDHGVAILAAMKDAGIKTNRNIWDQKYVDHFINALELVRFRQGAITFIELPKTIYKKQFNQIFKIVKSAIDNQTDITIGVVATNISKEYDAAITSENEILRAVRHLTNIR